MRCWGPSFRLDEEIGEFRASNRNQGREQIRDSVVVAVVVRYPCHVSAGFMVSVLAGLSRVVSNRLSPRTFWVGIAISAAVMDMAVVLLRRKTPVANPSPETEIVPLSLMNMQQLVHIWWGDLFPAERDRVMRFAELHSDFPGSWTSRLLEVWEGEDHELEPAFQRLKTQLGARALDPVYQPMVGDGVQIQLGSSTLPATVVAVWRTLGRDVCKIRTDRPYQGIGRTLFLPAEGTYYEALLSRGKWRVRGRVGVEMRFGREHKYPLRRKT
jgi:hypothetical protein